METVLLSWKEQSVKDSYNRNQVALMKYQERVIDNDYPLFETQ